VDHSSSVAILTPERPPERQQQEDRRKNVEETYLEGHFQAAANSVLRTIALLKNSDGSVTRWRENRRFLGVPVHRSDAPQRCSPSRKDNLKPEKKSH